MRQIEVIKLIAEKTNLTSVKIKEVLSVQANLAKEQLCKKDEFALFGIGKLKAKQTKERTGRNPATGEAVKIKPRRSIRLSLGKEFKSHFVK